MAGDGTLRSKNVKIAGREQDPAPRTAAALADIDDVRIAAAAAEYGLQKTLGLAHAGRVAGRSLETLPASRAHRSASLPARLATQRDSAKGASRELLVVISSLLGPWSASHIQYASCGPPLRTPVGHVPCACSLRSPSHSAQILLSESKRESKHAGVIANYHARVLALQPQSDPHRIGRRSEAAEFALSHPVDSQCQPPAADGGAHPAR